MYPGGDKFAHPDTFGVLHQIRSWYSNATDFLVEEEHQSDTQPRIIRDLYVLGA